MLKIIPNPNKKDYDIATKAVKEAHGYCPCRLKRDASTKCICDDFKKQNVEGYCCCGRYLKVEVGNEI